MSNPVYKKVRIAWKYPTQPTSLQVGTVRIVRSTQPFTVEDALNQTQIDYREYSPEFTFYDDGYELEEGLTYYYMIICYGDIDDTIIAATGLYSIKIEAPTQTPTISCDGATDYADFAILLRDGADPSILDTEMLLMIDGEGISPMSPFPDWLEVGDGEPNPYGTPSGFIEVYTLRYYNGRDANVRLEFKSLSDDIQVFAYNNPTSIQLSDDNSHVGACLSKGCVPSEIRFGDGIYDLDYGTLYGMNMTLQTPKGTVSGDFLIPLPEYSNTLHYLIEQYLYENISLISDGHAGQLVTDGGGGSAFIQVYRNIRGGNGRLGGSPFDLILKPLEGAGFDAYGLHFENSETVIHVCGLENFPGV